MSWVWGLLFLGYLLVGILLVATTVLLKELQHKTEEFSAAAKERFRPDFVSQMELKARSAAEQYMKRLQKD